MREGTRKYDINCEPKSFKCEFLGKLVVQQPMCKLKTEVTCEEGCWRV